MDTVLDALRDDWQALVRLSPRIGAALLAVALSYVLGRIAGNLVERALRRRRSSLAHLGFFRRLAVAAFVIVGVAVGLGLVGLEGVAAGLLTGGSLVAVVMAFAFRGIGENLLSGLFLAFSCPFEVGNFIASGEFEGDVRSVELRYTHIRTADGRDVYVPNAQIFNSPLVNFTRDGLRRFECTIGIDYAADTGRALATMVAQVAQVQGVLGEPAPSPRVREMGASYVTVSVLYWVDVFKAGRSSLLIQSECNERVRRAVLDGGFTVSSAVSTAIEISAPQPIDVALPRA